MIDKLINLVAAIKVKYTSLKIGYQTIMHEK